MEYTEIVKMLSNPDKLADGIVALNDYNEALVAENAGLKKEKTDNEARIKGLQESNYSLMKRITGQPEDKKDEDEEMPAGIDRFKARTEGGKE